MASATAKLLIGLVAVIGLIATPLILSQAAIFQTANSPIESMTFLTDFGVTPKSMPFFVSQERGYFEGAGVSPRFLEGRGSNFAMTQLDAGQADMAIVDASTLIARVEEGAKVKAVMVLLSKPQIVLNVLKESGIEDLEDLEGRRIGDVRGSTLQNLLPVAMRNNGLNLEAAGRVLRLTLPAEVEQARTEPPMDTRAWARGRAIKWAHQHALPGSAAWHRVRIGKFGWRWFHDPLDPRG